jgi:hypothetical protein
MSWNRKQALAKGRCKTRDGRIVLGLHEATLHDETHIVKNKPVLIGDVVDPRRERPKGTILLSEAHIWPPGGLGHHGGDDLVDE